MLIVVLTLAWIGVKLARVMVMALLILLVWLVARRMWRSAARVRLMTCRVLEL